MSRWNVSQALQGTPYLIDSAGEEAIFADVSAIVESVTALRSTGELSDETLRLYHGTQRYEQVAESNALEGSTLSVGETEMAIAQRVTLTGHDPGYVRDAIALDAALQRLVEMARIPGPTNIAQLKELHGLMLEGCEGAGSFRNVPVRISGSDHHPPKTWSAVMGAMEEWQAWSITNAGLPAPLRATVLHAWLAHIHPFRDGNGRASRAIMNLELVRAGYPPAVIKKDPDRPMYIRALRTSDEGDIGPFLELILGRIRAAIHGLAGAASTAQGYDEHTTRLRLAQANRLVVWNSSIKLFRDVLKLMLAERLVSSQGDVRLEVLTEGLDLDDFLALCSGSPISRSWAFRIRVTCPGLDPVERLAWIGYRSPRLRAAATSDQHAPSLFWSKRKQRSYPPWEISVDDAPGLRELSVTPGLGDEWYALTPGGACSRLTMTQAAAQVADGFMALLSGHRPT